MPLSLCSNSIGTMDIMVCRSREDLICGLVKHIYIQLQDLGPLAGFIVANMSIIEYPT